METSSEQLSQCETIDTNVIKKSDLMQKSVKKLYKSKKVWVNNHLLGLYSLTLIIKMFKSRSL
jgi:hypothetical protein